MIRLLVVDDSALMRRLLGSAFAAAGGFELAFARDGEEALAALHSFGPDVVTLDVRMPGLDGLACLDRVMVERPCRVVMVSALTADGAEETLRALDLGAVDFVEKPHGPASLVMDAFAPKLIETVRAAAQARLRPTLRLAERVRRRAGSPDGAVRQTDAEREAAAGRRTAATTGRSLEAPKAAGHAIAPGGGEPRGVLLVGCSTGGPPALEALLSGLPQDFGWAVVVAQHMPASFTGALARRLDGVCALHVQEVGGPVRLASGGAYIGRGDADVLVSLRGGRLIALPAPAAPDARWRPSVDRLVDSAMAVAPTGRLAGVLMTGMGDDGARAMTRLHAQGGSTFAEAEETAVVWGMPGALVRAGGAGAVVPLEALASRVVQRLAP